MWVHVAAVAAVIGMGGAVALILFALGMRSRASGEPISCPICGGATRFHEPYLMCDECQRCVGLRTNSKNYVSR
jgi:hypothetical protein